MKRFARGEVWWLDLGMAAKVRPALILSQPPGDEERALLTVVPHTTSLRGTRFEIAVNAPFLRPGAFDCQAVGSFPLAVLVRLAGRLSEVELRKVEAGVSRWVGLGASTLGGAG